jgi:hypothetical protein
MASSWLAPLVPLTRSRDGPFAEHGLREFLPSIPHQAFRKNPHLHAIQSFLQHTLERRLVFRLLKDRRASIRAIQNVKHDPTVVRSFGSPHDGRKLPAWPSAVKQRFLPPFPVQLPHKTHHLRTDDWLGLLSCDSFIRDSPPASRRRTLTPFPFPDGYHNWLGHSFACTKPPFVCLHEAI